MELDVVDISRWQFGITTVYHFIFVPLTIGLAPLVALMQTFWVFTKKSHWYRATRFFGTVLLINFGIGVATGIVQEFQFGMNWSEYSRMIGDVFGGPLALEALIAFFFESTFLGLWIFGWGKIPNWLHTASIWIVAVAVNISAYFIIVANSFMQHPVGAEYNPETGRAELTDIVALLTNSTALAAFPHAVAGSLLTAGVFVLGVTGWWMVRDALAKSRAARAEEGEPAMVPVASRADKKNVADQANNRHSSHFPAHRVGWWTTLIASIGVMITGDIQAKLMFKQQPMKMASAESLCSTETDPMFSILTVGDQNSCEGISHLIQLPWILSYLAEGKFSGVTLQGIEDLQREMVELYGPGNYSPNLFVTYWAFRMMIGLLIGPLLLLAISWWFHRKPRNPLSRVARIYEWVALLAIPTPFLANSAGWVFTEMGRQPWLIYPNPESVGDPRVDQIRMTVDMGVSDNDPWMVLLTLIGFTLLYLVLSAVWAWLIYRVVLAGPPEEAGPDGGDSGAPGLVATVAARFGIRDGEDDSASAQPVRFSALGAARDEDNNGKA